MRFKQFLSEMAARIGNVDADAAAYAKNHMDEWESAPIVYESGNIKVRKFRQLYSLWENDEFVFNAKIKEDDDKVFTIDDMFTPESKRRKGYLSKFVDLLLNKLGARNVVIGNKHSDTTEALLRANGLSKFGKSWVNMRTGKIVKHDPADLDKYYQDVTTSGVWKLYLHK